MHNFLIYGASGHAKVVIEALESMAYTIDGVFDDDSTKKQILDYPVVGTYNNNTYADASLVIAIGSNAIREKISSIVTHRFGIAIHKSVIISKRATIGVGSMLLHGSIIQSGSSIGKHVIINTNASVDHDCIVEDFVHIAPSATICGGVSIGRSTLVGANAVVLPNITIGSNCTIGSGAVVTKSIPANTTVKGNPARIYPN